MSGAPVITQARGWILFAVTVVSTIASTAVAASAYVGLPHRVAAIDTKVDTLIVRVGRLERDERLTACLRRAERDPVHDWQSCIPDSGFLPQQAGNPAP